MGVACSNQTIPRKVLLTGPKGSGKTTLLYYWSMNTITETIPTESFNIETIKVDIGGQLLVWDVTDTARRRQFYHGTDAIVYVYAEDQNTTQAKVREDLITLLTDRDLQNLPLLLLTSKTDISGTPMEQSEETLNLSSVLSKRSYACAQITMTDTSTYDQALKKLIDLFYT
ncbi:Arf GTPase arl1 [Mactra antiquata]